MEQISVSLSSLFQSESKFLHIMDNSRKKEFTGMCICGHEWDDHHHGCIMNPQALIVNREEFRDINGMLGEECEATQFEGQFTPTVTIYHSNGTIEKRHYNKMCECGSYWDKGWGNPDK